MKKCIFFSTCIIILTACGSNKHRIEVSGLPSELYKVQQFERSITDSSGYQNMAVHLYEDGTYSHFAVNFYNYGTWRWNAAKKQLQLIPKTGSPLETEKLFSFYQDIDDVIYIQKQRKVNGSLVQEKRKYQVYATNASSSATNDPFTPANNSWRIPPAAPETPQQIKQRTLLYLQFVKLYYQHALKNELEVLAEGWYPTPIQMLYANGARMSYSDEVQDWYKCFYNEEQGIEGYKLIAGALRKSTIPTDDNKARRNKDLIEQMIAYISAKTL